VADASFASFLERSLAVLESERPDVATRLAATLASLAVTIRVGDEQLGLCSDGRRVRVDRGAGPAPVDVRAERATLLALIDGARSLVDAVLADELLLTGDPADLARFHDALWLYLQGAVRAPSFPALLDTFRGPDVIAC